jgi:hypothetical protein
MFKENKYAIVKDALSQDVVNIASQYALLDEMHNYVTEGKDQDAQVKNAHSKYADLLMESLLLHLKPAVEWASGLTLIPTYSYFRVYRPGNVLLPHQDRVACEISTTVCFNYNYQNSPEDYFWPMFVETPEGPRACMLKPGDMAVYKGCEITHWREKFDAPEYSYHVQAFFHYVDANGPYADWALDKRPVLGSPAKSRIADPKEQISNDPKTKSYITYVG